jgi:competence protein ComEA
MVNVTTNRRIVAVALVATLLLGGAASAWAGADGQAKASAARKGSVGPVNVNTASRTELTAVPGIGKTLAQRIVEFREKNGPFRRIEDLMRVKGIGEKSFEKMRSHLTVGKSR